MKKYLFIFIAAVVGLNASAQYYLGWDSAVVTPEPATEKSVPAADSKVKTTRVIPTEKQVVADLSVLLRRYTDSLATMRVRHNAEVDNISVHGSGTNPYYYRLFVNPLVYRESLRQAVRLAPLEQDSVALARSSDVLEIDSVLNDFFVKIYLDRPDLVNNTDVVLDNLGRIRRYDDKYHNVDNSAVSMAEKVQPMIPDVVIEPIEAVSRRPNFWKFTADVSGKLTQNYTSDNWYQGSSNFNSWMLSAVLKANYNNKQKLTLENTLQMELGFQSDKNDSEHKYKTNTDNLRLTNKLNLKATKHWNYSTSLMSWTQFCPKFGSNSKNAYSDFMSPFESVLSIGMDYKYNKNGFNISVGLNPLSYDFKYVDRRKLVYNYGTRGHHSMETIGSNVQINMTWQLLKEIRWTSRVYYFTNLKKAQCEWENTFNFSINKYLNTELKLYPRFDDSYKSPKSNAILQFKEYLALSFKVSF